MGISAFSDSKDYFRYFSEYEQCHGTGILDFHPQGYVDHLHLFRGVSEACCSQIRWLNMIVTDARSNLEAF